MKALAHLAPFVVVLATARVEAGEPVTPQLVEECLRQAVEEDNARCVRVLNMRPAEQAVVVEALAAGVYAAIPKDGPVRYNPRWEALARHLGRQPTALEFLTSQDLVNRLMADKAPDPHGAAHV